MDSTQGNRSCSEHSNQFTNNPPILPEGPKNDEGMCDSDEIEAIIINVIGRYGDQGAMGMEILDTLNARAHRNGEFAPHRKCKKQKTELFPLADL